MRLRALLLATAFVAFALPAVADEPTECDRLAASPDDLGRTAPAVQLDDVDGAAAEAACRDEIEKNPAAGRFIFQLARALEAEEKTDEARDTYQAAVDAGYLVGYLSLGRFYEDGVGTEIDYAKAAAEYQAAVDKGLKAANGNLGYLHEQGLGFPKDTKEAARLYQLGVDAGDPWSAVSLGLLYENGDGVAADKEEAVRLYRIAAEGGDPWGQFDLGLKYKQGDGIEKDVAQAIHWFDLSAKQKNGPAARELAFYYRYGIGVAKDENEAERLFRLAIASDDEEAAFNGENELAWMFAQSGRNLAEAASLIDDALERADDDDTRSAALDTAAWVDHMRGNNTDALKKLQEAIDIDAGVRAVFRPARRHLRRARPHRPGARRLGGGVDLAGAGRGRGARLEPGGRRAEAQGKQRRSPAPRRRRRRAATRSGRRSKADSATAEPRHFVSRLRARYREGSRPICSV